VIPWYGYSRQDKKSAPREPITAKLVAEMLQAAGVDRVLTMDLHAGQVQGFFRIPVDHMTALPLFARHFRDLGLHGEGVVSVSPDTGRAKQAERFEEELKKLADGLARPRTTKEPGKIRERIGRIKERYARAAQHYAIEMKLDEAGKTATGITWVKTPKPGTALTDPGVYCLRTTLTAPTDAELWKTYSMLTNLEAVFRSLKTDLGLRPVFHRTECRVDAHLFISLLAYIFVHTIRTQLKARGIDDSWDKLRSILTGQVRITATVQRKDGRTVHVRKATRPEVALQRIYTALKLSANPGGVQQTIA